MHVFLEITKRNCWATSKFFSCIGAAIPAQPKCSAVLFFTFCVKILIIFYFIWKYFSDIFSEKLFFLVIKKIWKSRQKFVKRRTMKILILMFSKHNKYRCFISCDCLPDWPDPVSRLHSFESILSLFYLPDDQVSSDLAKNLQREDNRNWGQSDFLLVCKIN